MIMSILNKPDLNNLSSHPAEVPYVRIKTPSFILVTTSNTHRCVLINTCVDAAADLCVSSNAWW